MRTLVHLSDLHFGRVDHQLIDPLINSIREISPQVVAVSGDLTQRARSHEFRAARAFLDSLPQPQIVVPGNHDVPLHNVFTRFLQPLEKYRRYVTDNLEPFFADDEIAVVGVNTARSLVLKGGRINRDQVARIREKLCPFHDRVVKIVVTHHPFDLPEGHHHRDLVGRSRMAMTGLAECGADVFLAGHLHVSHTGHTAERYKIRGHSALVVQAGTASSTRGRGEVNSFNVLRLDHPEISVERFEWQPDHGVFASSSQEHFRHSDDGWVRV
jgi:3',5'-cyclic AMP phosphodiesterase CpdA